MEFDIKKHSVIKWALGYIAKQQSIFEDKCGIEFEIDEAADLEEKGFGLLAKFSKTKFYVI
jgi:hypothetical protein